MKKAKPITFPHFGSGCERRHFHRALQKPSKNHDTPSQKIKLNRTQSDLLGPKTLWGPFFYALSFDRGPLVRRGVAEGRLSSLCAIASAKSACRAVALAKAENLRFFASKTPRVLSFFAEFCGFLRSYFFSPDWRPNPLATVIDRRHIFPVPASAARTYPFG